MSNSEIYARLDLSPIRRWIAILIIIGAGVACIYLAASRPPSSIAGTLSVLAVGLGFLWVGRFIHKRTSYGIVLSAEGLWLEDGTELAKFNNIEAVDRSIMAFKPSNGFAVKLHDPGRFGWAPGVWWRVGRRMGIGGATSRDQARHMADTLSAMLRGEQPEI